MNPQAQPPPTPAPIQDIYGAVWIFPYPIWMVVVSALVLLGLLALAVWFIATHRRPKKCLTPAEKALAELARLRAQLETNDPYTFSIEVSDVLRVYLRDARGLSAPTQTSREFLETVRAQQVFSEEERTALSAFLEKADLIKFARMHATAADSTALLEQAERLVRSHLVEPEAAK